MLENAVAAPIDVEWQDLSQAWWSAPVGKHLERLVRLAEQADNDDCRTWLDDLDRIRDSWSQAVGAAFARASADAGYDVMFVDPWRARREIAEHHVPDDVTNLDRPQFEHLRLEAWQAADVPPAPAIPAALTGASVDPHVSLEAAGDHGYCATWRNGDEAHFEVEAPGEARHLLDAIDDHVRFVWDGESGWAVRDRAVLDAVDVDEWLRARTH